MQATNHLIIGSGVAGLTLAIKLAGEFPNRSITVITKATDYESNTRYAQGGVAAVLDGEKDSFQKHIEDTLRAGDGLCDRAVVEKVIKEGPQRLKELMKLGAQFDADARGKLELSREGGHSESRVVHYKDRTGHEIERTLLKRAYELPNITLLAHHFVLDLLTTTTAQGVTCQGAYVLDQKSGSVLTMQADSTVLASGGIGQVYGHTTNPLVATGDGIAMASRVGAQIRGMEFIQFHPTAFYDGATGTSFLISEAVRGFGAYLRNASGTRFMLQYDPRAELASRDIVSRAIGTEMNKEGNECVYLDCTHLEMKLFRQEFPTIYETCLSRGFDVSKDWIPVVPAAHYLCGGIAIDVHGRTSVEKLFACGECTYTGLHGANRLASNSLLEALVYAHTIFGYHSTHSFSKPEMSFPEWAYEEQGIADEQETLQKKTKELQHLMRSNAGMVRNTIQLQQAAGLLDAMKHEVEAYYKEHKLSTAANELRNMIAVAQLIITHSLLRKENKGGYYNTDYELKTHKEEIV